MAKKKQKEEPKKIVGQVPLIELPENTIFFMATQAGTLTNQKKEQVGSYGVTLDGGIYLILRGKNYKVSVHDVIEELNKGLEIARPKE